MLRGRKCDSVRFAPRNCDYDAFIRLYSRSRDRPDVRIKPFAQTGRQRHRPFGEVSTVAAIQAQGPEVRAGLDLPPWFSLVTVGEV